MIEKIVLAVILKKEPSAICNFHVLKQTKFSSPKHSQLFDGLCKDRKLMNILTHAEDAVVGIYISKLNFVCFVYH